jgi:hypothetical protein
VYRQDAQAISTTLQAGTSLGKQQSRLPEYQAQAGKGQPWHLVLRICAASCNLCDAAANAMRSAANPTVLPPRGSNLRP